MSLFDSPIAQLGAVGMLAGVLVMLFTGRIWVRAAVRALVEEAGKRVEEAGKRVEQANVNAAAWQRAAEASDQRADQIIHTLTEQTAALRAVEALVRAPHGRGDT
jgi:hypothetical protein